MIAPGGVARIVTVTSAPGDAGVGDSALSAASAVVSVSGAGGAEGAIESAITGSAAAGSGAAVSVAAVSVAAVSVAAGLAAAGVGAVGSFGAALRGEASPCAICGSSDRAACVLSGSLSRERVNRTMLPSTIINATARPMYVESERAVRLGRGGRDESTSVGCRATGSRLLVDTAATG